MARAPDPRVNHPRLRTGDAITVRQERWRVEALLEYPGSSIVDVDGCDHNNRGTRARFILPFESVAISRTRHSSPRIVTLTRWRRAARVVLAEALPHWTALRAATRADFTILPFQLEPALAVTRGDASRILIADEVGLGKTIQAGLVVAETIARWPDARILVVSPAGLREQWRNELQLRFHLNPEVVDAEALARHAAFLVPDVNPWSIHQVAITSVDYVKRPEVMRALEPLTWDVIVFDEAHSLAGRSDRAAAAAALARRARTVVMLTATPHSGEDEAYMRLCALGELQQSFPLTTFRRTRSDIGLPHNRRSTHLRIRPSAAERLMHDALAEYAARLTDRRTAASPASALVASVLLRRACSSATSLMRSLERRASLLAEGCGVGLDQLTLPFVDSDSDDQPGAELGVPGLVDSVEETTRLRHVMQIAGHACSHESKLLALTRLVRRTREPVLVFTEYRDTLLHVSAALVRFSPLELHGGLTTRERTEVIRRFAAGGAALLIATDAASEGLNLHHACRLVVNLELPWTPLRLEQRIGRVDRLGQSRRVHAMHLVARGTAEETMVARHQDRVASIKTALDAQHVSASGIGDVSKVEAQRLTTARSFSTRRRAHSGDSPLVTIVTRTGRSGRIWIFRLSCADADGQPFFDTVAGLQDAATGMLPGDEMSERSASHHAAVLRSTEVDVSCWVDLAVRRETAMILALRETQARLATAVLQPGLFDRRAERAAAAQASRVEEANQQSETRLAALERLRQLRAGERSAVLGILFRA